MFTWCRLWRVCVLGLLSEMQMKNNNADGAADSAVAGDEDADVAVEMLSEDGEILSDRDDDAPKSFGGIVPKYADADSRSVSANSSPINFPIPQWRPLVSFLPFPCLSFFILSSYR